jgi:hypothetical protein
MKSSFHSLIPLPFLLNRLRLRSPELDQILFRQIFCNTPSDLLCPFIISRHGPNGKHLLLLRMRVYSSVIWQMNLIFLSAHVYVFTELLPRNGYTGHNMAFLSISCAKPAKRS